MVDEADELYGLPDDEFTAARDALAKRLRGEKRRDEADEVKALRRPSVAAAAINRAVREHGADELLAAGEALREAHEALLSGDGDAKAVREATAREREAVREFTVLALGDGASASTEEKVRATLHAASVDDDVRDLLVAGRLERDAEAGADPMAMLSSSAKAGGTKPRAAAGAKSGAAKSGGSGATKSGGSAARSGGSDGKKASRAGATKSVPSEAERRRIKAAERAQEAADRAVTAQAEAEAAAERARSTLEEAEAAARKARAVVEDLEGHERAARRALKEAEAEAERRRTEARRAVKAAESRA
jgi:hypothetical protein